MIDAKILLSAMIADALIGDPENLPHPIRVIGAGVTTGEKLLRPFTKTPVEEFLGGALLTTIVVGGTFAAGKILLYSAEKVSSVTGGGVEIWLAFSVLAARNLCDEANAVLIESTRRNPAAARIKLQRIVGRDTQNLSETEISRAVIETVAESFCDGIIAPLFYLIIGGVPLALGYKAVNTLDSMIGHRETPYLYFGKFAARLDDLANYIPARIAAGLIITAAGLLNENAGDAWRVWRTSAALHRSPNAGQTEAAMAGALNVRLGGINYYDGEAHQAPFFGANFDLPSTAKAETAIRLIIAASILGYAVALTTTLWSGKK